MPDLHREKRLPPSNSEEHMRNQANGSKSRRIIILCILTAILLVIWSLNRRRENSDVDISSNGSDSKTLVERWQAKNQDRQNPEIEQRLSLGEQILIGADNNPDKQLAVEQFAAGNFTEAQIKFAQSLKANPNDPETLIYLNNSLAATDPEPLKIGVSVPIGGSLNVAKEILRGVAQAQNEINKQGGIERDGFRKLVQVQIANDDNNPEIAKQIAADFVADPEIMAVVGHNSSSVSMAAAPIYQQGNLVMVSPTSVARELSQAGSYIFRTTPSTRVLAETIAQYAVDSRRSKVAVCLDSSEPASVSFQEEFSLSLFESGGEIISTSCDFANEDFNPDEIPAKITADGAEALLLIPSVNKINQALDVAKATDNRLPLLGNDSMYTYETLDVGRGDIKGLVVPAAWHPDLTATSSFNKNALELWGMAGSWRTATAYDATKVVLLGLNSATTRQELQQTLVNSGFAIQGATGKVAFRPSGDRQTREAFLIKANPGKASGTGYDFAPIAPDSQSKKPVAPTEKNGSTPKTGARL